MRIAAALALGCALALAAPARALDQIVAPGRPWLLSEFDWGDSRDLVEESVGVTQGMQCQRVGSECAIVTAFVDDQRLLVKFAYRGPHLHRIRLRTPALPGGHDEDLERVWKLLVAWVTRYEGAPKRTEKALPPLYELVPGGYHETHEWQGSGAVVHVGVGREGDAWFVAATFVEPASRAPHSANPKS
jgi:hypothetical protein